MAFLFLLAACSKSSTAATIACSPPDYVGCPNYAPTTMRIVNQSTDTIVELATTLPTPGMPGDSTSPISDVAPPGGAICQLLGRWQPDSVVPVAGLTALGTQGSSGNITQTNLGLHNLRSSPGWTARFDAGNAWHFSADTACSNPSTYTF